jgi:hypothetical protein
VEQLADQENADLATLRTTALPVEPSETKTAFVCRLHAARTAFACGLLAVFPQHPSYQQPHQQEERCNRYLIHKPSGGSDSIASDLHSDWITVHLRTFIKTAPKDHQEWSQLLYEYLMDFLFETYALFHPIVWVSDSRYFKVPAR